MPEAGKGRYVQKVGREIALMLEAGYVFRYAGRYREAREVFQAVRTLLPHQEIAELALAGVSVDEGKFDEAVSQCRRALDLNRASAAAYTQLAEIQLLQRDGVGARQNLQRALDMQPNGPTAELAKALMKLTAMVSPDTRRVDGRSA